jgi:glutathione S-transferase
MLMAKVKLYGVAQSRVMRNIWMLEELRLAIGLTHEHDPIRYNDPALKQPPYSLINPNARVPMLQVDDFSIFESLAINLYLAEKFPSPLSLTTPEARALGAQWAMWALTEIELPVMDWAVHTYINAEADRKPDVAKAALDKLQRPLKALDVALDGRSYLVGDSFSVVDLNVASVMYRLLKMDLSAYPNVNRWMQACWAREGAKAPRRARGETV